MHDIGHLPTGMSEGLIAILYKKKIRTDPRNYRPITLLNSDYKILMRILTNRFAIAVKQFVSATQNGFVPDSFICENIMLLQLLQAFALETDMEALFIFLDMEKAFDRCAWEYLTMALQNLGFPSPTDGSGQYHGFIRYVLLAYSHEYPPLRQLIVNGFLGPKFPIHSGVAQGCPISPLLQAYLDGIPLATATSFLARKIIVKPF